MTKRTDIIHVTCSNLHKPRTIAIIVPRTDFEHIFKPEAMRTGKTMLIWVNTALTANLRDPQTMPSGTTDLDRKNMVICPKPSCRHPVDATEETFRTRVYEPAMGAGRTVLDISELERILTTGA